MTRQEPKVDFCEKKYVFDAIKAPDAKRDPVFDASAKCPVYAIPDEIADAVREKQQRGSGRDRQADFAGHAGGADQYRHRRRHAPGVRRQAARRPSPACRKAATARACRWQLARAPGTIPSHVNPPRGRLTSARRAAGSLDGGSAPADRSAPADPRGIRGAAREIRRLLLQSRPQGRHRRSGRRRHRQHAAGMRPPAPAKPKVIEAKRRASRRAPKHRCRRPPQRRSRDTKQPPPSRPPLKPSVSDAPAPAAPGHRSPARSRSCRRTRSTAAFGAVK